MIDPATKEILEWFTCSYCELDVLKFILLSLVEPSDSPYLSSIVTALGDISNAVAENVRAGVTEPNRRSLCSKLTEDYHTWRRTGDNSIRNRVMLPKIFALLELNETRSSDLMNNLSNQSINQRLSLRLMLYCRIKGMADFVRNEVPTAPTALIPERNQYSLWDKYEQASPTASVAVYEDRINKLEAELEQMKTLLAQKSQHLEEALKVRDNMVDRFEDEKVTLDEQHRKAEGKLREQMKATRSLLKTSRAEVSKYQEVLASKVNANLFDDGSDGQMDLRKRVDEIHRDLEDFTKVKGSSIGINEEAIEGLLAKYHSRLDCQDRRTLWSAALRRLTVKKVFEFVDNLYRQPIEEFGLVDGTRDEIEARDDKMLEAVIVQVLEKLLMLTQRFSLTRGGNDNLSLIVSNLIRRQVYTSLGKRAFKDNHRAISDLVIELLNSVTEYRIIQDDSKKREFARKAMRVIIGLVQLRFCLKAQEPEPELKWYESGRRINLDVMDSTYRMEDISMEVDLCYFPAIGSNLTDEKMRVIFGKAQVIAKERERRFSRIARRQMSGDRIEY